MAQYISVKRKQQTNKRAPLAITLCLLFLLSSFNFVFAGNYDIATYQVPYLSSFSNSNLSDGLNIYGDWYCATTTTDSAIIFATATNVNNDGRYYLTFFQRVEDFDPSSGTPYKLTASNGSFTYQYFQSYSDADNVWKYSVWSGSNRLQINTSSTSLPVFASVSDAIATLNQLDFSAGSGGWSGPATVSVEAGCVAYILVDGGTATLTTTFPELSKLSRPLWTSGSTYSFENDLPSSGKVFSSTSGTLIDWLIPASAKTDLLGRSYQGGRPLSDLPSGQYLVVYNPVYRGYDDKGVGIMSPTIYVSLSNYGAVRQFRLTASYNGGLIESTSDDGYSSWFDSIGEEELDANGNPIYVEHLANGTTQTAISIPAGGGNIIVNSDNADNSIGGLLERLLNLLTAPIKYIERLYSAAVQFFDYLSSLWGWLPVEVTSIIGAALAVLVVIGVVKFLWK